MGTRRLLAAGLTATLTAGILVAGAGAASALSTEESQFVSKINAERSERDRRTLTVRSDLVRIARRHSERMASKGKIWHNDNLPNEVSGDWRLLGENVGMGPTVPSLHKAFMNSEGHRRNILNREFNEIGVGVVISDDVIYVTEVFANRVTATVRAATTTTKEVSTRTRAPAPSAAPAPASAPAPKPKPKPEPRTVDVLLDLIALDADAVDPATGTAAGF